MKYSTDETMMKQLYQLLQSNNPSNNPSINHPSTNLSTIQSKDLTEYVIYNDTEKFLLKLKGHSLQLRTYIAYALSSQNVLHNLNIKTISTWNKFIDELYRKYEKCAIQAGEMVGPCAAESVGEGNTQSTLNTFKTAGIGSALMGCTARLKELIDNCNNMKMPQLILYLKPPYQNNERAAWSLARSLERLYLQDVVSQTDVLYDPNIYQTLYTADEEMVQLFSKTIIPTDDFCRYMIRIELNQYQLINREYNIMHVVDVLHCFLGDCAMIWYSSPSSDKWVIRIRLTQVAYSLINKSNDAKFLDRSLNLSVQDLILSKVVIGGLKGTEKALVREVETWAQNEDGSIRKCKEFVIETEGSDLQNLTFLDSIDWHRCYSNNVQEIYELLGVEAAAHVLFHELKTVLTQDSFINDRHIMMIVNFITYRGNLVAMNRFGMNRQEDASVLARATFEEPIDIIMESSVFSKKDPIKGVSECLIAGKKPQIGTHSFDIVSDLTSIEGRHLDQLMNPPRSNYHLDNLMDKQEDGTIVERVPRLYSKTFSDSLDQQIKATVWSTFIHSQFTLHPEKIIEEEKKNNPFDLDTPPSSPLLKLAPASMIAGMIDSQPLDLANQMSYVKPFNSFNEPLDLPLYRPSSPNVTDVVNQSYGKFDVYGNMIQIMSGPISLGAYRPSSPNVSEMLQKSYSSNQQYQQYQSQYQPQYQSQQYQQHYQSLSNQPHYPPISNSVVSNQPISNSAPLSSELVEQLTFLLKTIQDDSNHSESMILD